jgi:hypothetical protein
MGFDHPLQPDRFVVDYFHRAVDVVGRDVD